MATPLRNVRVSDELWLAAKARAEENGQSLTEIIVRALSDYVSE
jgi:predicted HicB family RNase H-like nuclease